MKTILITHQKGGVGKSTLSFNIAQNICSATNVVVVDFDAQGSLSKLSKVATFQIKVINNLSEIATIRADFLIIDTPPYLSVELPDLFKIADVIIIPTKPGILDLFAIDDTITLIKESKALEKAHICFNMVKPNTNITGHILAKVKELGVPVLKSMVSDRVVFTESILTGGVESNHKAQKEIDALTKELLLII